MEQNNKPKMDVGKMLVIALKLLVICGGIALLVAGVNMLTKDRIKLNGMNDTVKSLDTIYGADGMKFAVEGDGYSFTDKDGNPGELTSFEVKKDAPDETFKKTYKNIDTVFAVGNLGYCVMASPMGFKDEVSMIVAVNPDFTVRAVSIGNHSETSGIGSKVKDDPEYVKGFVGLTKDFAGEKGAELKAPLIISGATRTSKPVSMAVDEALKIVCELYGEEDAGNE